MRLTRPQIVAAIIVTLLGVAQPNRPTEATEEGAAPRLIVQITLDQFRADYLDRYGPALKGGLRRMMDEGALVPRGIVDHGLTNSYPGHASLSTGRFPSGHGLSANEWWVERDGRWTWVDGTADPETHIVGQPERTASSPRNLRATTLGEWVKAADADAKAISLSTGNYIATVYGGTDSDGVYWFDSESSRFVTSTFWREDYPAWVSEFNERALPAFKKDVWAVTVPHEFRGLASADDLAWENEGQNYSFPHRFADERPAPAEGDDAADAPSDQEAYNSWFAGTPMKDEALFALARIAVTQERLGLRGAVDYLAVAIDSTDGIGHNFGGESLEILDALVRIDRALGEFLDFLDDTVGEGRYIVAISGDHGAPNIIEAQQARGLPGRRISVEEIDALMNKIEVLAKNHEGEDTELIPVIEAMMEDTDFIFDALTEAELSGEKSSTNPWIEVQRRSYVPGRIADFPLWASGDRQHHPARYGIIAQYHEHSFFYAAPVVHGSPYDYDRQVPIMLMGSGVRQGIRIEGGRTIDVAPTLAALAGISIPDEVDGSALLGTLASLAGE